MSNCPECGGRMAPRATPNMHACVNCGKLVVGALDESQPDELPVEARRPEDIRPEDVAEISLDQYQVPDYTEVMVGWRSWKVPSVVPSDGVPLLRSVSHSDNFWYPGVQMEATCNVKRHARMKTKSDVIPYENCECGLYSAKTREHLMSMRYHTYDGERSGMFCVVGTVNVWGKTVEGTQGWRSQFGYPRELYVPFEAHHLAAPLAEAYKVPVRLNNILKAAKS